MVTLSRVKIKVKGCNGNNRVSAYENKMPSLLRMNNKYIKCAQKSVKQQSGLFPATRFFYISGSLQSRKTKKYIYQKHKSNKI